MVCCVVHRAQFPLIMCATQLKRKGTKEQRLQVHIRREREKHRGSRRSIEKENYQRHRVLIVLNNCTTMGPKYVDRKVMKASRAMSE